MKLVVCPSCNTETRLMMNDDQMCVGCFKFRQNTAKFLRSAKNRAWMWGRINQAEIDNETLDFTPL